MRKYGMPYMGGKTKLAEKFVDIFPRATHFYDLFCGGCAVAHRAIVSGKYQHVHVNDLNPIMPKAFKMALNGEFDNERRWISREDFERLKNSDPYVAICFSFGNNLRTYLYNSNIEEMKKALHYAIFFLDFDLAHKYFGDRIDFITDIKDEYQRYLAAKKALSNKNTPPIRVQSMESCCRLRSIRKMQEIRAAAYTTMETTSRNTDFNISKERADYKLPPPRS